ncbi:MAG: thiamine phosphate synthase [Alphaproteobacteria bacterium]
MSVPAPLLVISDRRASARGSLSYVVAAAFAGGCRWLMVREKDLPPAALAALVEEIVALARPFGAAVSVNGDATVAVERGARGVHLPQGHDVAAARRIVGETTLVGVSAHSLDEARAAEAQGVDYVTLSPVFPSASKPGYGPVLGADGFARIAAALDVPVVALGGITAANANECLAAGAAGVAVLGAVMHAEDPARAVATIVQAIAAVRQPRSSRTSRGDW